MLSATFEDNMITLDRAVKDGDTYTGTAQDYITSSEEAKESNIYVQTYKTDLKETQVRLTYDDGISDKEPKLLKPKQVVLENIPQVSLDRKKETDAFYVYGHGRLQGTYNTAGKAIQKANDCGGVVVDADQTYIWERGNRDLKYSIDTEDADTEQLRQALAGGKSAVDAITEVYGNVMDLSGCTIDELLYNVNQGRPLIAVLDAQTTLMIVGYSDGIVSCEDIGSGARSIMHKVTLQMSVYIWQQNRSEIFVLALRRARTGNCRFWLFSITDSFCSRAIIRMTDKKV